MYTAAVGGRIMPDETMHFKKMLYMAGWREQVYIMTYIAAVGECITPDETMHFKEMLRMTGWREQVYRISSINSHS